MPVANDPSCMITLITVVIGARNFLLQVKRVPCCKISFDFLRKRLKIETDGPTILQFVQIIICDGYIYGSLSLSPRLEFWQRHDYTSLNVILESSESESESEEEREGFGEEFPSGEPPEREIHYLVGDVTQPQNTGYSDAIVVHCVGV